MGPATADQGVTAQAARDGGVEFVDAKGKVVSRISAAIAWDARVDDATGDPVSTRPVTLTITQRNPGKAVLSVTRTPGGWPTRRRVLGVGINDHGLDGRELCAKCIGGGGGGGIYIIRFNDGSAYVGMAKNFSRRGAAQHSASGEGWTGDGQCPVLAFLGYRSTQIENRRTEGHEPIEGSGHKAYE